MDLGGTELVQGNRRSSESEKKARSGDGEIGEELEWGRSWSGGGSRENVGELGEETRRQAAGVK